MNVNETRETAILESKRIESRFENFFGHRESRSPGEEINRRNSEREVLSKLVRSESKDRKAPRRRVEMHYEKCTSSWKGKVCCDIVVVVDSCPHPRASSSYRRETQTSSWAGWRLNSLRAVVIRLGQSFAFGAAGCARCRRGSAAVFIRRNAINRRNLWKRQVDKRQVCSNFLIISQLVLILPTTRKHFDDKVFFSSFFFSYFARRSDIFEASKNDRNRIPFLSFLEVTSIFDIIDIINCSRRRMEYFPLLLQ